MAQRVLLLSTHRAAFGELLQAWLRGEWRGRVERTATPGEAARRIRRGGVSILLADLGHAPEGYFLVARRFASCPVVFLADQAPLGWICEAIGCNAAAYLGKCARLDDIARTLHAVRTGLRYFAPCAARMVAEAARTGQPPCGLTAREREVLRQTCDGKSTKEIASGLRLQAKTVELIRSRLMEKTGTRRATDLVRFACNERFVTVWPRGEPPITPGPGSPFHR